MPINTLGSANISVFEIKALVDLCNSNFIIDATPSVFIGTGANNVLGIKIKIENPYEAEIKSYPITGYDILPPITGNISVLIPKIDGNFDFGNYKVTAILFDTGGKSWEVIKNLDPCQIVALDKSKKVGQINATIEDDCNTGKVFVKVFEPPTYKGIIAESRTQSYTLTYPSSSLLPPLVVTQPSFSTALFQGEYIVDGNLCVTYNKGGNIYYKVPYNVHCVKNIKCLVDTCAVFFKLEQLGNDLVGCSDDKSSETSNIIFDTLRLLSTIEWARRCGQSLSKYILELEKLLGINCTCSISDGTPIVNNVPSKDVVITGCNVTKTTNGLTDTYEINNHSYKVTANPNQNIVSISAPQLNGCEYIQQIEFDINNLYNAIKTKVVSFAEYTFWGNAAFNAIVLTDANLLCLGLTRVQWDLLTASEKFGTLVNKMCACCSTCNATISGLTHTKQGANILVDWNNTNVYEAEIYLNGNFIDKVLDPISNYLINGAANGNTNIVKVVALCKDGSKGNELTITFTESGCATIATPTGVTQPPPTDYACPFDLNTLLTATAPIGLTYEWHNANNTQTNSIVANPTSVLNGNYFIFLKDANGCYSLPVQVQVDCRSTSCSEPQNIMVNNKFGDVKVTFESAAFPPPANSYTVKRRLSSDADTPANYTTLTTPIYNSTTGKWETTDTSAVKNTLYVYRAISNCTSSAPYINFTFADIDCILPEYTVEALSIDLNFAPPTIGNVTEIKVELFDNAETTLLQTKTYAPAFSNPTNDTFTGLTTLTTYKLRTKVKVGSFERLCDFVSVTTL